jgi:hypothetical protein
LGRELRRAGRVGMSGVLPVTKYLRMMMKPFPYPNIMVVEDKA